MAWSEPVRLTGQHVTIVPLSHSHCADLVEAVKDGELWKLWYTFIPTPDKMASEIDRRLRLQADGSMLPFAVIENKSDKALGMTTYMNINPTAHRLEIGSTWYRAGAQRTPINTECKLLLLTHAFEALECIAVEFRTSFFNQQSRKAIERLGAKQDGILRNEMLHKDGTLRDTCVYSIIGSEWPTVKTHLSFELERRR
jgi:RimJ/RimL family protein N-acetyltransferase